MTTEMQNENVSENEVDKAEFDEVVQNSDSSTETHGEDKPQVSDNAQKRINELTAEKYALKRQLEEREKQQQVTEVEQEKTPEVAPQLPDDLYDEDAMRKYHADMIAFTQSQAAKTAESVYQSQQTEQQKLKAQSEHQKQVQSYAEQGLSDGLTIEQMQKNETILNGSGISSDLGMFLMGDKHGAKLADYLANSPDDLQKVLSMNPMQAAVYISGEIKSKALAPSNISNAPEPTNTLATGSASKQSDDFDSSCPGAVFD